MPFLINRISSDTGVMISIFILICSFIISTSKSSETIYLFPITCILIFGIFILIWWRKRITNTYIEKLKTEEIKMLQKQINEKDAQLEKLKADNESLSKIIHKDNKLIPALVLSVKNYLEASQNKPADIQKQAEEILKTLDSVTQERTGIVKNHELESKPLPSCGVLSVDAVITYMFAKARENGIDFNVAFNCSIKFLVENIIKENLLNTLLADLIENALIASKKSERKSIFISFEITNNIYSVNIFDNGIPFEAVTLANMGTKRITTHADEGGSGIGMVTTFEILKICRASLIIEEFENNIFTKKVSIKFDGKCKYMLKTSRTDEFENVSSNVELIKV